MDYTNIEPFLADVPAGGEHAALIPVLQKSQELHGYLSKELLIYISDKLGIPRAKVYGVATFYAQFRLTPVGKFHILLCQGTACHVNGSGEIAIALRNYLDVADGGTTEDGVFTLTDVACLGCCSLAPAMMVGEDVYGNLTPKSAIDIINKIRSSYGK
ncbi:MAG: NADH-quinone oxidoreductase subunit NuoE [Defluviitaleaceae bacterium]|nr:NADH-quinone oxidoreductase subunit NuoE [Defluviitaleaceae bacterium]